MKTNIKNFLKTIVLAIFVSGCTPEIWNNVDISQINFNGDVVCEWKNVKIEKWSKIDKYIRFRTYNNKLIELNGTPLKVEFYIVRDSN